MINKENLNVGYYVVAFIDLLGQKERLKLIDTLPNQNDKQQMDEFLKKVRNTYGIVETLYELFEDYFDSYKNTELSKPIPNNYKKLIQNSRIKFQTFSDGIVIYIPTLEDFGSVPVQDIFGLLGACASSYLLLLAEGFAIRGGIEIGIGFESSQYGVYGPVVPASYELEKDIAQYPRIIIGNALIRYLQSEKNIPGDDIVTKYRKRMATLCMEMIEEDVDGYFILDVLGKSFKENIARKILDDVPIRAYDFILKHLTEFKLNKSTKLSFRYQLLKAYFEKKIDIWIKTK